MQQRAAREAASTCCRALDPQHTRAAITIDGCRPHRLMPWPLRQPAGRGNASAASRPAARPCMLVATACTCATLVLAREAQQPWSLPTAGPTCIHTRARKECWPAKGPGLSNAAARRAQQASHSAPRTRRADCAAACTRYNMHKHGLSWPRAPPPCTAIAAHAHHKAQPRACAGWLLCLLPACAFSARQCCASSTSTTLLQS